MYGHVDAYMCVFMSVCSVCVRVCRCGLLYDGRASLEAQLNAEGFFVVVHEDGTMPGHVAFDQDHAGNAAM